MILFKGKKAKQGPVHTMDITLEHIRQVFLPKNFHEKYKYLGSVPYNEEGDVFKVIKPIVLLMDLKAKPWWCPRWFLRFLHLFGSDNSIVRVRNITLSNLKYKITKGFMIWDYKTKWQYYDLRISISGDNELNYITRAIESQFYREGKKEELINILTKLTNNPKTKYEFQTLNYLEEELIKQELIHQITQITKENKNTYQNQNISQLEEIYQNLQPKPKK